MTTTELGGRVRRGTRAGTIMTNVVIAAGTFYALLPLLCCCSPPPRTRSAAATPRPPHRLRAVPAGIPVTVTGWALAAATPQEFTEQVDAVAVALGTDTTSTRLVGCHGWTEAAVQRAPQGTAYGAWALVPALRGTVVPGELLVSASTLTAAPGAAPPGAEVDGTEVAVTWSDGIRTTCAWAAVPEVTTTP